MRLEIYFDEDSDDLLVLRGLRSMGYECHSAVALRRGGLPDAEQLSFAANAGWLLVTSDKDYLKLHSEWMATGSDHAGIVFVVQKRWTPERLVGLLGRALAELSSRDRTNGLWYLSNWEHADTS